MYKKLNLPTKQNILLEKFLREYYDFSKETLSSESENNFKFGIELEGYFDVTKLIDINEIEFRNEFNQLDINSENNKHLKNILNKVNYAINERFNIENFFSKIYYDESLQGDYDSGEHFALEFVTRVLNIQEFRQSVPIMKFVIKFMDVVFDEYCGFHISFSNSELPENPEDINWLKVYILSGLYESGKKYKRINNSYAREIIGNINDAVVIPQSIKLKNISKNYPTSQKIFIKILSIVYKLLKGEDLTYEEAKFLANRGKYYFKKELIFNKYNAINLKNYKTSNKRIEIRLFGNNAPNDFENVVKQTINVALATYFVSLNNKPEYNKIFYDTFYKIINDPEYKKEIGISRMYEKEINHKDFLLKLKDLFLFYKDKNDLESARFLLNLIPDLKELMSKYFRVLSR